MNIDKLVLLLGFTTRSQAYIQALRHYDIQPKFVILYGDEKHPIAPTKRNIQPIFRSELFSPDLMESLLTSIKSIKVPYTHITCKDLENKQLLDTLSQLEPALILFSGYGGQVVPDVMLRTANKMLHIHSGRLPEYRGSTTIYYSILNENLCAVSAILLDTIIDTGPIVARKEYSIPPPGTDVDYLFDNTIRADLLVDVLKSYAKNESFSDLSKQSPTNNSYYIIHPVLKHLALLKVDQNVK